ncbi:hypothetical protein M427DRAFT_138155 [Gonapodya prolifera JEL478]|uniref:Uncharacterized protein n=1 Tax=Gonapodya prolifera (strain JEL478) TaxID=1344416 RepID=A0A139A4M6_GONPJ|nr:hypothetical protein M427DRAFT_138155 [Gonapodya prolifera JEL478]|eukprot:KXS11568.1 hypothetical protein M427DRAFT_138155 [Gonapodya prolifera JEL478]
MSEFRSVSVLPSPIHRLATPSHATENLPHRLSTWKPSSRKAPEYTSETESKIVPEPVSYVALPLSSAKALRREVRSEVVQGGGDGEGKKPHRAPHDERLVELLATDFLIRLSRAVRVKVQSNWIVQSHEQRPHERVEQRWVHLRFRRGRKREVEERNYEGP